MQRWRKLLGRQLSSNLGCQYNVVTIVAVATMDSPVRLIHARMSATQQMCASIHQWTPFAMMELHVPTAFATSTRAATHIASQAACDDGTFCTSDKCNSF